MMFASGTEEFRGLKFWRRHDALKKIILLLALLTLLASPAWPAFGFVNINTASKEDLMTLKYVGEFLAEKIIAYRNEHPFQMPEEIMNVKGIGKKIFDANKWRITCSG